MLATKGFALTDYSPEKEELTGQFTRLTGQSCVAEGGELDRLIDPFRESSVGPLV